MVGHIQCVLRFSQVDHSDLLLGLVEIDQRLILSSKLLRGDLNLTLELGHMRRQARAVELNDGKRHNRGGG